MSRAPYLMRVCVSRPDRKINLWLPLFIIFPVLAVILLVLSPLILITAVVLWFLGWGKTLFIAPFAILGCMCAMRGLEVEVEQGQERVLISVK